MHPDADDPHVHSFADAYDDMGRTWLGLGNINGPFWFCGLEPGGTETPQWPSIWATRYKRAEVIDGRLEAGDPDHARHFGPEARSQKTWLPLIRTLLAFKGEAHDDASCLQFQRDTFLSGLGEVALLELSAFAASNLTVDVPRHRYTQARIARIRELLLEKQPTFFHCYGTTRRRDFEQVVGGVFDAEGFRICGRTICTLTIHPTPRFRAPLPPSAWVELAAKLRLRVTALN